MVDGTMLNVMLCAADGVAKLMYTDLRDSGSLVTKPSGTFSVHMAEHAMGLLIALARNFPDSVRYQDQSKWTQQELWDQPQHLPELNAQVLLIVGYGSIGPELPHLPKTLAQHLCDHPPPAQTASSPPHN